MNPSHAKRLATGLTLLALLAAVFLFRGAFEWPVLALFASLGLWEFYTMIWKERFTRFKLLGIGFGLAVLVAAKAGSPWLVLGALIAAHWTSNLRFLLCYSRDAQCCEGDGPLPEDTSYPLSGVFTAGLIYLPLLLSFVFRMQPIELCLVLASVMAADTGAYYAGSFIGGPKIWPAVSPKKTWAGSAGGLAASVAVCLAMGALDEYWLGGAGAGRWWWTWVCLGVALNLASQFGDFFESALKRRLGVKDSGSLLPGHGGVLDRIDSLLLALPVYVGLDSLFHFFER